MNLYLRKHGEHDDMIRRICTMLIVGFLGLLGSAQAASLPEKTASAEKTQSTKNVRAVVYTISPETQVYDVQVAFPYVTTVYFPQQCRSVSVGDPETFSAMLDTRYKNKVVIFPHVDAPGARSNVAIECEEHIRVVLDLVIGSQHDAMQSVEFVVDEHTSSLVAHVKQEATKQAHRACQKRIAEAHQRCDNQFHETVLHHMETGVFLHQHIYASRDSFLIARMTTMLTLGTTHYVSLTIKNHSREVITLRTITMTDENNNPLCQKPITHIHTTMVLEPKTHSTHLLACETLAPPDGDFFIVVTDETTRRVRVGPIPR